MNALEQNRYTDARRKLGALSTRRYHWLVIYEHAGPDASLAVPTAEHCLPLLYLLGAQHERESLLLAVERISMPSLGMMSVWLGAR